MAKPKPTVTVTKWPSKITPSSTTTLPNKNPMTTPGPAKGGK